MRSAIIELSAAGSLSPSRTFEPIRRQRGIAHRFDTRRLHSACKIRRPGNQRAGPDFEHSQGLAHHQHLPSAAFGDRGHSMTAWVMRVAGDLPPAPRMRKRPCRAAVMANGIIYLVGLIVIIMFILSFLGLR